MPHFQLILLLLLVVNMPRLPFCRKTISRPQACSFSCHAHKLYIKCHVHCCCCYCCWRWWCCCAISLASLWRCRSDNALRECSGRCDVYEYHWDIYRVSEITDEQWNSLKRDNCSRLIGKPTLQPSTRLSSREHFILKEQLHRVCPVRSTETAYSTFIIPYKRRCWFKHILV